MWQMAAGYWRFQKTVVWRNKVGLLVEQNFAHFYLKLSLIFLDGALARMSELGVQNTQLGWIGCPIPFHPIALYTKKNMHIIIRVSKRHLDTPLAKDCNMKLCNQLLFSNQLQKCCSANHGYCYMRDMMKHDLWLAEFQFCNWLLNSIWLQSFMWHPPVPRFLFIVLVTVAQLTLCLSLADGWIIKPRAGYQADEGSAHQHLQPWGCSGGHDAAGISVHSRYVQGFVVEVHVINHISIEQNENTHNIQSCFIIHLTTTKSNENLQNDET